MDRKRASARALSVSVIFMRFIQKFDRPKFLEPYPGHDSELLPDHIRALHEHAFTRAHTHSTR
jgi:hypothetical protein